MSERKTVQGQLNEFDDQPVFGRALTDKFLLAIIDAHPDWPEEHSLAQARRREQRLHEAHLALFGDGRRPGRPADQDGKALCFMAHRHEQDLLRCRTAQKKTRPRSVIAIAKAAADKFYPENDRDAAVERLRHAFPKQKKLLMELVMYDDGVAATLEQQYLSKVQDLLRRGGISMILSDHFGS